MSLNFTKNILIAVLTVSAIYLTGQLWFEKISNRNFFYSFLSSFSFSAPDDYVDSDVVVTPFRVISNMGSVDSKKFMVMYTELEESNIVNNTDTLLAETVRRGEYVGASALNWNELLNNRVILYDYKLSMPTEIFADSFGQRSNSLTSKFKSFNMVAVIFGRGVSDKSRVIFIDEPSGTVFEYSTGFKISEEELNLSGDRFLDSIFYISSVQSGIDKFETNVFIPQMPSAGLDYDTASVINPYSAKGNLLISDVENKVGYFFNNPASKHSLVMDNAYTFSDQNTVVKYYTTNTLEYSDYRTNAKVFGTTLASDYHTAINFIAGDESVINEFYLEDYLLGEDSNTFYFNYKFNNFPIILPKEYRNEIGMDYAIEVTVLNKAVVNYKKLAYNFSFEDSEMELAETGYTDVLDSMASAGALEGFKLSDLELGYKMEQSKGLRLNWFIKIGDIESVNSAQRRN